MACGFRPNWAAIDARVADLNGVAGDLVPAGGEVLGQCCRDECRGFAGGRCAFQECSAHRDEKH